MQRLLPEALSRISNISSYPLDNSFIDFPLLYPLLLLTILSLFLILPHLINHFTPYLLKKEALIKGFTLIELLVVIAILAVLAVIAFASFNGLTARGNDDRRRVDIKSIADVYEVKRTAAMADYGTEALAATDFSTGAIPVDPITAKGSYCIRVGTAAIANATISTTDGVDGTGCHGANWVAVSTTAIAASQTFFKICAANQANTATFCVGSKQ